MTGRVVSAMIVDENYDEKVMSYHDLLYDAQGRSALTPSNAGLRHNSVRLQAKGALLDWNVIVADEVGRSDSGEPRLPIQLNGGL